MTFFLSPSFDLNQSYITGIIALETYNALKVALSSSYSSFAGLFNFVPEVVLNFLFAFSNSTAYLLIPSLKAFVKSAPNFLSTFDMS